MAAAGTPQSSIYNSGYGLLTNQYRDRSSEQSHGNTSMMPQFNYAPDPTQSSNFGRYTPPTLKDPFGGASTWNNQGGYSYNLPNSFGNFQGNQGFGAMGFPSSMPAQQQSPQQMAQSQRPMPTQAPSQGQAPQGGDPYANFANQLANMYGARPSQPTPGYSRAVMPQMNPSLAGAMGNFRGGMPAGPAQTMQAPVPIMPQHDMSSRYI